MRLSSHLIPLLTAAVLVAPAAARAGDPPPARALAALFTKASDAQTVRDDKATLAVAAPAFLYPDRTRTPLSVLEAGTSVEILRTEGDWYLVSFQDPLYGPRQGFIEKRFVRRSTAAADNPSSATPRPGQQPPRPSSAAPKSAAAHQSIGAVVFAAIDLNVFAASKTYQAVFGSSTIPGYGGGADITGLWRDLFVRAAVTRVTKTGSRVFVNGPDVFPLNNEPAKLTLTPIEIGAGWRFTLKPSKPSKTSRVSKPSRLTPYVGAAALIEPYKVDYPTSPDLNESQTFFGGNFFGGVQYAITKVLIVGGEAQYRLLPNALKSDLASSVANVYNESQGGGFTARVTIGVKLGK